jgi:Ca2+-binding EF-hand superfamily protein
MFRGFDLNNDGVVTRADFQLAGAQNGLIGMDIGNQVFNRFDFNGDGRLNAIERFGARIGLGGGFF